MEFKDALSNRALKDYGALSKMIKQGKNYKEPQEPKAHDYELKDNDNRINKARFIKDLKDYGKEINKLKEDHPKLYGLIIQYLSQESLDEIKRQENYEKIEEAGRSAEVVCLSRSKTQGYIG